MRKFVIALILCLWSVCYLQASPFQRTVKIDGGEFVSLNDISAVLGGDFSYEPMVRKVVIEKDDHRFVFLLDRKVMIIDRDRMFSGTDRVRYLDGEFYLDRVTADYLADIFVVQGNPVENEAVPSERSYERSVSADSAPPQSEVSRVPESRNENEKIRINTIAIDAGHGGDDPGAVNPAGYYEKDITLEIAQELRDRLKQELPGIDVILTRRSDETLRLDDRPRIASRSGADLFVSLHLNSSPRGNVRWGEGSGIETYVFDMKATDAAAEALAERENMPGEQKDDLSPFEKTLFDLKLRGNTEESLKLAQLVQDQLVSSLPIPGRGVKRARFYVLKKMVVHDAPSILVELGFLNNKRDFRVIRQKKYQRRAAEAIAAGIVKYLGEYNERYRISMRNK